MKEHTHTHTRNQVTQTELNDWMQEYNILRRELAEELNIQPSAVSRIIFGARGVSFREARKIEKLSHGRLTINILMKRQQHIRKIATRGKRRPAEGN